jgi:hypothetical protein
MLEASRIASRQRGGSGMGDRGDLRIGMSDGTTDRATRARNRRKLASCVAIERPTCGQRSSSSNIA